MRQKLFRGQNAEVWQRRLIQLGWPLKGALDVARFLTGDAPLPPPFAELDREALVHRFYEPPEKERQ